MSLEPYSTPLGMNPELVRIVHDGVDEQCSLGPRAQRSRLSAADGLEGEAKESEAPICAGAAILRRYRLYESLVGFLHAKRDVHRPL